MIHRFGLVALLFALALSASGGAQAALIEPNALLPDGSPGFALVGRPPNPNLGAEFLIGFNAKPPNPSAPALDLADPQNPVLRQPGPSQVGPGPISIYFGWKSPGPPQFSLPMDAMGNYYPPNPCVSGGEALCYDFGVSNGANQFDVFLQITGGAIDPASWVIVQPGPPTLPAVQLEFSFLESAVNPALSFQVMENGEPLDFAVPEPAMIWLLALGLSGALGRLLGGSHRRDLA